MKEVDPGSDLETAAEDVPPRGFMAWLRHAFAIEEFSENSLEPQEKEVLQELARIIHRRGMSTPAIIWIESNRHLNFASSQLVKMIEPIHDLSFSFMRWLMEKLGVGYITPETLGKFQSALEKRYSVEYLLQQIEKQAAAGPTGVIAEEASDTASLPDETP